jgi:hypothetical protein
VSVKSTVQPVLHAGNFGLTRGPDAMERFGPLGMPATLASIAAASKRRWRTAAGDFNSPPPRPNI